MLHTANVDSAVPTVTITFNCSDPAHSVTQTYGPGNHTDADQCVVTFVSATIAGVTIPIGSQADVQLGSATVKVAVSGSDNGRHITVDILSTF